MKRLLIGIGVVAAIGLPATASASSTDLAGNINPSGTISMTVKKKNGHTKVVKLIWHNLPVSCNSGDYTASGDSTGFVFKVNKQNEFGATLTNQSQTATAKIAGKLKNHGTKATGTIRQQGQVLTDANGTQAGCDSGKDDWSAEKV
jgi:hypothetical protein